MIRLDKLISTAKNLSRKEARELIRAGRVEINGLPVRSPDVKTQPGSVTVDGCPLGYQAHVYLMLHKPAGVLSASRDATRPTVLDLIPKSLRRRGLFPVGRLDKDTRGLLLITDDGDFSHRVISPKSNIPKLYEARLSSPVGEEAVRLFAGGILLSDGTKCRPARLELFEDGRVARVTVSEGKYHQVRRMFAAAGSHVEDLIRLRIGGLALDEHLSPGACRELSPEEMDLIFEFQEKI